MENSINQRIKDLVFNMKLSQSEFANRLSVSKSRISNIVKGRNKPDSEMLQFILTEFRNVNARWLLLGEGEMLKSSDSGISNIGNGNVIGIGIGSGNGNKVGNININGKEGKEGKKSVAQKKLDQTTNTRDKLLENYSWK
jgi:DNA-binding XRE family transcriptional regulator